MKKQFLFLLIAYHCLSIFHLPADNFRQISSKDGLSNSSVCCVLLDDQRFLWLGTYDGLNMYDGNHIHIYKPEINNPKSLSSNVIRNIIETGGNYLWVSTKWGLNKLSKRTNRVEAVYPEFRDDSYSIKDRNEHLFIIGKKGLLSFYDETGSRFIDLPVNPEITCENIQSVAIDLHDTVWINHKGILERYTVSFSNTGHPQIIRHPDFRHPCAASYLYQSGDVLLIVDTEGNIYSIAPRKMTYLRNISRLISDYGKISCMLLDDNNLLIGFKTNGVFRSSARNHYRDEEKLEINCGVFTIKKDEAQDILWIGTDGQGVYAWIKDDYKFGNLNLMQLPVLKQRPVRAIYTDRHDNLWLGTKDNGVIRIADYKTARNYTMRNVTHFTTENGLSNNEVFAFNYSPSHDVLWIGSNGPGMNYYSFRDGKMHSLTNHTGNSIQDVHALLNIRDSLLLIGAGNRLLKVRVENTGNRLVTRDTKQFTFNVKYKQPHNQIYALFPENDSILWIGVRGNGIVRFNLENEEYQLFSFDKEGIAPINDILCIHQDKNGVLWLGSSYGITRLNRSPDEKYAYKNFNETDGLSNNTIHGILEDPNGKLWLSSNAGIILFDAAKGTFRSFNRATGLKITEFSDNAYYKSEPDQTYFFGGIDGLVWIKDELKKKDKHFTPGIFFTSLRIFNEDRNIYDFEKRKGTERYIELSHKQNFFAISFTVTDFINGENSRYAYKLSHFSDVWINAPSNEAQFTNIPPGSYTLTVKCNDGTGENEDSIQSIRIVILPPWYLTVYAKIVYLLLFLWAIYLVYYIMKKKYESRKLKLQEKYKEEMYEGKLRFFTNITHEFSTPLTLIYGPCERILSYQESDSFIKKYAQIIKSNAERLNSLIQEIIDFRRMETGNKVCRIEPLNISRLTSEITGSFNDLAEQNHIRFESSVNPDIQWNSDSGCYTKILNNLISNAFKYTPAHGNISVTVGNEDQNLTVKVYNTGKGIKEEDIPLIFNRYTVLDNIRENSIKGLSSRNGLGLAICHSMTELLRGTIKVHSEINRYAEFTVTLPRLELNTQETHSLETESGLKSRSRHGERSEAIQKDCILIIDDNAELLWMLKDILSGEYKVVTAPDGKTGLDILKQETPDLIITDIMMPNMDGITLTKQLKENKHTMHIPLVILSAKNTNEEKIAGLNSGADIYIPKPFDTEYLKTVIRNLIKNKKNLEIYYNSSASAFEFANGQLLGKENKDFLRTVLQLIDTHIANEDFSVEQLAGDMQTSVRNLYRKFKELNLSTPNDFIKEQRLQYAGKLIKTTRLTVQEIMYKSGFTNQSHFYKEFAKRFGKTPKEYRESSEMKDAYL